MRCDFLCLVLFCGLVLGLPGCAGSRDMLSSKGGNGSARSEMADALADHLPQAPQKSRSRPDQRANTVDLSSRASGQLLEQTDRRLDLVPEQDRTIRRVNHEPQRITAPAHRPDATRSAQGRTHHVQLVKQGSERLGATGGQLASGDPASPPTAPSVPPEPVAAHRFDSEAEMPLEPLPPDALQLNLPTALSLVGGQHPVVGFAQWRVHEAYARFDRAKVLWLPSIQPGFSFHRHDGNFQASDGSIIDINRNSFQFGLGAGATGAGTTNTRPGIVAQFHLADAIFQPQITQKTAWARGHAANGVVNEQLLNVAVAYLELLDAEQDLRIVQASRQRTSELSKLTEDFAATGQGLQADADRLRTELSLVENRLASARERVDVASARLSQALSIDAGRRIMPLDPTVVPIELVSLEMEKGTLISTGLSNRPELKAAQALVAAANDQYQRQRYAPFVPSVLLGFSTGGFGGGLGDDLDNIDDRYDFDAVLAWEIRNLGFGEGAARRETAAQIQQARFETVRVMDRVARQVAEAHSQVVHRARRITITQDAIASAENSYQRNLSRIRDGQGLPLEVLQSVRALEDARRAYLKAVIEYNQAQFRLQWALGWPVFAPEQNR